jgi:hypothetical protein
VVGWAELMRYPHAVLNWNSRLQAADVRWDVAMPNLRGIIGSFLASGSTAGSVLTFITSVACLAAAVWYCPRDPKDKNFDLGFSLAVIVTLLSSYYLFPHDLSLLLLPLMLATEWLLSPNTDTQIKRFLASGIALLFFSPLYFVLIFRYGRFNQLFWLLAWLTGAVIMALARNRAGQRQRAITPSSQLH